VASFQPAPVSQLPYEPNASATALEFQRYVIQHIRPARQQSDYFQALVNLPGRRRPGASGSTGRYNSKGMLVQKVFDPVAQLN
jgi:hypothetical protein